MPFVPDTSISKVAESIIPIDSSNYVLFIILVFVTIIILGLKYISCKFPAKTEEVVNGLKDDDLEDELAEVSEKLNQLINMHGVDNAKRDGRVDLLKLSIDNMASHLKDMSERLDKHIDRDHK